MFFIRLNTFSPAFGNRILPRNTDIAKCARLDDWNAQIESNGGFEFVTTYSCMYTYVGNARYGTLCFIKNTPTIYIHIQIDMQYRSIVAVCMDNLEFYNSSKKHL